MTYTGFAVSISTAGYGAEAERLGWSYVFAGLLDRPEDCAFV
jgi:hypothetical protein